MRSGDDAARPWLLRRVTVAGELVDCRLADGVIAAIGPELPVEQGETVFDADGGALLPGLADHHVHLFASAAAAGSLDLGGGPIAQAPDDPGTGWLRVIGCGDEPDRRALDRRWPHRPVRVQHRSGATWTLNTVAIGRLADGLSSEERRTGVLWRSDTRLRRLLRTSIDPDALAGLGARLAGYGLTQLTDATPDLDARALATLRAALPQHVASLGPADATMPAKIVVADSELPTLDALTAGVRDHHEAGRAVAIHAVSAVALALTIAALRGAGAVPGDRIEHAAVCDDSAADQLAQLHVVVVTQPGLAVRHGARYLADSEPAERPGLWRYAGLLRAGVSVAVSSDAPYGPPDPWATIRAATTRRLDDGAPIGAPEAVPPETALATMLTEPRSPAGPARAIAVGAPADLCVLRRPVREALSQVVDDGGNPVAATFVAGVRRA
jgi:predicted amidohydrolase YtcJ